MLFIFFFFNGWRQAHTNSNLCWSDPWPYTPWPLAPHQLRTWPVMSVPMRSERLFDHQVHTVCLNFFFLIMKNGKLRLCQLFTIGKTQSPTHTVATSTKQTDVCFFFFFLIFFFNHRREQMR